MNSLKSLFPDREGYVIILTVLHKTRRSKSLSSSLDSDFDLQNKEGFYGRE